MVITLYVIKMWQFTYALFSILTPYSLLVSTLTCTCVYPNFTDPNFSCFNLTYLNLHLAQHPKTILLYTKQSACKQNNNNVTLIWTFQLSEHLLISACLKSNLLRAVRVTSYYVTTRLLLLHIKRRAVTVNTEPKGKWHNPHNSATIIARKTVLFTKPRFPGIFQFRITTIDSDCICVRTHKESTLIPRPPLFFVIWFAFSKLHGSWNYTEPKLKNKNGRPGNEAIKSPPSMHFYSVLKTHVYFSFNFWHE